jgi:hypothetical protein
MKLEKINLKDISLHLKNSYDIFICSASFEERCLSVAYNVEGINFHQTLIIINKDFSEQIENNKNILFEVIKSEKKIVEVSSSDPLFTADNLNKNINIGVDHEHKKTILLDITTFTHETLLILIKLIQIRYPKSVITGIYSNALEYSLGEDDINKKWLSKGISEVRSVLGYPGNIVPSRKTHLILIVGYENERAESIIEAIEPNSIALGYGRSGSATTDKNKEANEHYMNLVKQMATSYSDIETFEIPCDDPFGARNILKEIISKEKNKNILIAPMNNKLSTLGAAWVAFENENVQICYAQALTYNFPNYSSPGLFCYIVEFP